MMSDIASELQLRQPTVYDLQQPGPKLKGNEATKVSIINTLVIVYEVM